MKKSVLTIAFGLLTIFFIKAQSLAPEIISTAGDYFQGTAASLSWTLGEPVTETSVGNNAIITQGFQQYNYNIISIVDNPSTNISVSVYPNPAIDIINIAVNGSNETIYISLSDMNGKSLLNKKTNEAQTQINIKQYSMSNYLLVIKNNRGETIRTFKIIKSEKY